MSVEQAIADAFEVTFPKNVAAFLSKDEKGRVLELTDGFVRGSFICDFGAEELANIEELADAQWIDEGDTLAEEWKDTFGDLVPIALLIDADADEEAEPYKGFLAVDAGEEGAPVFLWDYDGWHCYLIALTFADFLAGKAPPADLEREDVKSSIGDRDKIATPYRAFGWKKK